MANKRILINVVPELKDLVNNIKSDVKAGVEGVHSTLGDAGLVVELTDAGIARALATDVLSKVFSNGEVRAAVEKATATLLADSDYLSAVLNAYISLAEIEAEPATDAEVEEEDAVVA